MGAEDNFWASGPTGPCGPCSELYYDFHPERGLDDVDLDDDSRFIEFYNLVFMELNRDAKGELTPLEKKNIDTGMGLERMAQILQQVPNNYECDLLRPIMSKAEELSGMAPTERCYRLGIAAGITRNVLVRAGFFLNNWEEPAV
jgi:alanyl-tRNA synthetase